MQQPVNFAGDGIHRFGGFILDLATGQLSHHGEPLHLPKRALDVLAALVAHADQTVDKEQLFKEVWPDVFVEENNLARHVSVIRKALHKLEPEQEYIVTIPGRGYRFSHGDVRSIADASPDHVSIPDTGTGMMQAPPPRRHWSFTVGMAAAAVVVVVSAVMLIQSLRTGPSHPTARRLWQATTAGRIDADPSWSPDGQSIAFTSDRSGNLDIWVQSLVAGAPRERQLTFDAAPDSQPAWSPDGRWLAFRSERDGGGLFLMPAAGGPAQRLVTFGQRPRWSPDGRQLLFASTAGRRRFVVSTGGSPAIELRPEVLSQFRAASVSWSPDGESVSVYGEHATHGASFWIVPVRGGAPRRIAMDVNVERRLREAAVVFSDFQWSPSADSLYFQGRADDAQNIWRIDVDRSTLRWSAGPERLTAGASLDSDLAVSPDGQRIAFFSRTERTSAWSFPVAPPNGNVQESGHAIGPDGSDSRIVDLSVDGQRLAYRTVRHGLDELWIRTFDGPVDRLGASERDARILQPRWSLDGSKLAYLRSGPAREGAVILLAANRNYEPHRVVTGASRITHVFDWSADGRSVLVGCATDSGVGQICEIPATALAATSTLRVLAGDPDRRLTAARSAPDGHWISFVAHATNPGRKMTTVYVMPTQGGAWVPITEGEQFDDKPRWTPDSRTIYFLSHRSGFWNVWRRAFDPVTGQPQGKPTQVTSFNSPARSIGADAGLQFQFSVTRDRLILPITQASGAVWILENASR